MEKSYQPNVRLGNWYEQLCTEEEERNSFYKLRDSHELLTDKMETFSDILHADILLDKPQHTITFGSIVQLMPYYMLSNPDGPERKFGALSLAITANILKFKTEIDDSCVLRCVYFDKPCMRNSFRLISADDEDRTGEPLRFEQHFRLEVLHPTKRMFLYTAPKRADLHTPTSSYYLSFRRGEVNLPVGACFTHNIGRGKTITSAQTNWYCRHIDKRKRFESRGTIVTCAEPLLITHVTTNKNLAADDEKVIKFFGPEYLVSCQDYSLRREPWRNIWMLSNGHWSSTSEEGSKLDAIKKKLEGKSKIKTNF